VRIAGAGGRRTILTYCTNVHPIEDLSAALDALSRYCAPVRRRLATERLSLGLWLSRRAASALATSDGERHRLADALAANGLELVTLNAFPYGDFHAERVKEAVYLPDWADPRRYDYTLDLARILSELLPFDVGEGTISTLPLGYAKWLDGDRTRECAESLARLAIELDRLAQATGRFVRVCIEPEPDCALETTRQAIDFFWGPLLDAARRIGAADRALGQHLGICFDTCHHAVQFEDPMRSWTELADAGIQVGKVQLSCALAVGGESASVLEPFDEPRFLHQVRRRRDAVVDGREDLGHALSGERALTRDGEWRVHFHAPLHWRADETSVMSTTAPELLRVLPAIAESESLPHLEVETYTWNVLPTAVRPRDDASLVEGIAREIEFAERALGDFGIHREAGG
jgi:sugar phosphate isomerase/epimerase